MEKIRLNLKLLIDNNNSKKLIIVFPWLVSAFISFFQLELASRASVPSIFTMEFKYVILNIGTIFSIAGLIYMFVNNLYITALISELIYTIVAIINYYVIMYHSLPLSWLEVKNFKTAQNVISGCIFRPHRAHCTVF